MLLLFPGEVLHHVVYRTGVLSTLDVRALCLTCKGLNDVLHGDPVVEYDLNQHRALGGLLLCLRKKWMAASRLALSRGYHPLPLDDDEKTSRVWRLAVEGGDRRVVADLLVHPDVHLPATVSSDSMGSLFGSRPFCPLVLAATRGHCGMVELFLEYDGEDRVDVSRAGYSALSAAASEGHLDVVGVLLEDARVDPNPKEDGLEGGGMMWDDDDPLLVCAVRGGHGDVVSALFACPEIEVSSSVSASALSAAAYCGDVDMLDLLVGDERIDLKGSERALLRGSARRGDASMIGWLLGRPEIDPGAGNNEAIRLAAAEGHVEVVKLLLGDANVDPGVEENSAIRVAAGRGHTEVVALLLDDPRVDPSDRSNDAVLSAAEYGHPDALALLLADPRVDPTDQNNWPLKWAVMKGHPSTVALLLADSRVGFDDWAYGKALEKGQDDIIALLRDARDH